MPTSANATIWLVFSLGVLGLLALDLFVFHRRPHAVTPREAALWSGVWILLAIAFGGFVHVKLGSERALEYAAAYLVEKSLSVDNLFVFVAIFAAFAVPKGLQHRLLFWGVLGALVLRAVFIGVGALLLERFHWVLFVFGGILIFTAYRMLKERGEQAPDPAQSAVYRAIRRVIPATDGYRGGAFFVREGGRLLATPLFVVLLVIEASDVIFAVDSIPAVFAVTDDPFIVYTSNVFAILGLRSLYFLLADVVHRFRYLKVALAGILAFVGVKMLISDWLKVPIWASLAFIALSLTLSILLSITIPEKHARIRSSAGA